MNVKKCSICRETKDLETFNKNKSKAGGYEIYCKVCAKITAQRSYNRCSNKKSEYYQKNKEKEAEARKEWNLNNKDKIKLYASKTYQKHKHSYVAKAAIREASKLSATPNWLKDAHRAEMEGFYQFCAIFAGHEVDHIVPLNGKHVRGLHVPWNLQILTMSENRKKGNSFHG